VEREFYVFNCVGVWVSWRGGLWREGVEGGPRYVYTLSLSHARAYQNPETKGQNKSTSPYTTIDVCLVQGKYTYTYTYTRTHMYIHTRTHTRTHVKLYTHTHTFTHTHFHTHTHTRARTHT